MTDRKQTSPQENRRPLVTVQHESERDLASGAVERRMFVKMYTDVRTSGLFQAMPDELWKTLCLLATYMDEEGTCWPGQSELARHLNIRREAVGARIKRLAAFRFEGQPVISIRRIRTPRGHKRNEYHIYPISSLAIFDNPAPEELTPVAAKSMRGQAHMAAADPMRGSANMASATFAGAKQARAHTNQTQVSNQKRLHTHLPVPTDAGVCLSPKQAQGVARSLVAEFHQQWSHPEATVPTDKELRFAERLILAFGEPRARHLLSYGTEEAQKTGYQVRFFQGLEQYVAGAMDDYAGAQARADRKKRSEAQEAARDRQAQEETARFFARPLEERVERALETWVRTMATLKQHKPTVEEIAAKRAWFREVQQREEGEWRKGLHQGDIARSQDDETESPENGPSAAEAGRGLHQPQDDPGDQASA